MRDAGWRSYIGSFAFQVNFAEHGFSSFDVVFPNWGIEEDKVNLFHIADILGHCPQRHLGTHHTLLQRTPRGLLCRQGI